MKHLYFRIWLSLLFAFGSTTAYAFSNSIWIDGLKYVFSGSTAYVVYQSDDRGNSYRGDKVIPSTVNYQDKTYTVTSIDGKAFKYCSDLTSIAIPESVTSIRYEAFSGCSSLTSITIPGSVTDIGNDVFSGCSSLDKCFVLSSNPAKISTNVFDDFTIIVVPDDAVETYRTTWTDYANKIVSRSSLELFVAKTNAADGRSDLLKAIGGVGKEADIVNLKIEGTINGYDIMLMRNKMTNLRNLDLSDATIVPEKDNYEYYTGCYTKLNELGASSFYNLSSLVSVILPPNITAIGEDAFGRCTNLKEVTGMPDCCTSIGKWAFSYTGLETLDLGGGVTSIPQKCFLESKLPNIILPNSVSRIETYAFYNSELKSITLGDGVEYIGYGAFANSNSGIYESKLSEINFGKSLKSISEYAFENCQNLKELRLPPSLKTIDKQAFKGCSSITEIHVPSMLESIADEAFKGCTAVKDVYSYTLTPTSIKQNSFVYDGVTLHAPQEPEDVFWTYYNDTQWSQFPKIAPFEAKYEMWYTSEDQDITLGDGETIPNEDEDEKAEGEMRPGSCLEYLQGAYQWLNKLVMKWVGDKFPCLIDNSSVFIDELCFELDIKAGKWYFFSFPFNVDLSKCTFNGKYVWRYYDGDLRAKNGGGAWQNVTDGKLKAFQGYIFNAQKAGKITICISDPMFTGSNKRVNIAAHASSEAQNAGWNFVGNPFTSYYDLSNFIDEFDAPITVWDPVNNTYNAIVPGDDDYEFHPFEAFFVQKPDGQDRITFNKDGREGYNDAMQTLQSRRRARAAQMINPARRIVNLEISDGATSDKTRVVFNDERQMKYEPECDASKFMSEESAVQLFTIDNDDVRYAINERPNAEGIVRLGFTAKADGRYTISAARLDKAMALKDNETGTIHNLAEGDYEFLAEAGTNVDRFVLIPEQQTTGISELLAEGIKVEAQDGGINIAGIEGKTANIYNAAGQLVATLTESGRTEVSVGAYVVKIGEVSTKIVVR